MKQPPCAHGSINAGRLCCNACGADVLPFMLRKRGISKPLRLSPGEVLPPAANTPAIVTDLNRALMRFQLEMAEDRHRKDQTTAAVRSLESIQRALQTLGRHRHDFMTLAWMVRGSKPAALDLMKGLREIRREVRNRLQPGKAGRPVARARRNLAARVRNVLTAHGVRALRTREGAFEQTLAAVLRSADQPASNPLRLLRPRRRRTQ